MTMTRKRPFIVVSIATIPSRIASIEPTLRSILNGDLSPDLITVCTPKYCELERSGYEIPAFLLNGSHGSKVRHVEIDRDWGPGTKILGSLGQIPPLDTILIIADDDVVYHEQFVSRLVAAQLDDRYRSSSFYVYRSHGLTIATGCDGHAIWAQSLVGIMDFAERYVWNTSLLYHDDIWIAFFLATKGVRVRQTALPDDEKLIYTQILPNDVLSAQSGDLKRELIAATHLPRLFRETSLSYLTRLRLHKTRIVDLFSNIARRVAGKAVRTVLGS